MLNMNNSRTVNAAKNIIFGYVNKLILLVLPFFSRTVILYTLGAEYLGLGSLFSSVLQMLNMADLGFSSAIVFSLYKPLAKGDTKSVCGLMTYYKKIYMILGSIIFVVGLIIAPFLPLLIKGSVPEDINIYVIYGIYLLNTCLSYWAFAYKASLLQANQMMRVSVNIQSIVTILQYSLQIIILLVLKSYYLYVILIPIATIIINYWTSKYVDKTYSTFLKKEPIQEHDKISLKQQVKGLAITKVCGVMRDSVDSIVISAIIGLTSVAIYSNYFYVISAVHGVLTVITAGIRAGVGNSIATEGVKKNTEDMFKFDFLYFVIFSWCFVCIVSLYQDFMYLWAGESLMLPNITMVLFAVYFYLLSFCDIRNVYIEAMGLWWEYRIRAILETVFNLILNITFARIWGIFGILTATILTFSVINIGYGTTIIFRKYFGIAQMKRYYILNSGRAITIGLITCLFFFASRLVPVNTIIQLIVKAFIVAGFAGATIFLVFHKNKYLKQALKKVIHKAR